MSIGEHEQKTNNCINWEIMEKFCLDKFLGHNWLQQITYEGLTTIIWMPRGEQEQKTKN